MTTFVLFDSAIFKVASIPFQLASVLQTGAKLGMITMEDSLADLLRRGLITKEEARYRCENPDRFK
jgi:Tfp pilus assembly pilus retraction ATPase PilT